MILGKQLGRLRSQAGLSFEQAADALGMSHSTDRRMKAAKVARLRLPDVEKLLRIYGITGRQETSYLHQLAQIQPRNERATVPTTVPDILRQLIDGLDHNPAYIQNRFSDVLAVNALAAALSPNYRPGKTC
jgi:transcriptional regulator with XRE-family HTH domain